ncbi:MAG: sensor histidine kinase [bacterium]
MSVPLEKEGQYFGRLNLFWEFEDETFGALFAFGLIGIGGFIALLLLPVSRLITNPIKELHRSALRIADGDLTHRTNIKTKDEIGDLGDAFNQMAEKIERMIKGNRELTANISHELRSPLTRIRIAEELIREGLNEENGDIRKYLDSIQKEISELDSLIGQILLLSKLDISERPFQMDKIDLESVMIEILERMKPLIERNEIQIESEIAPGIPPVLADREAIKTALSNIVDNAVKFCPPGGRVEVSIKPEGGGVRISLANSCDPIPEDDLRRIFDPFYRVEGGGRKTEGAGLGLAITKKIIEGHAGTIEAVNIEWGLQLSAYIPAN